MPTLDRTHMQAVLARIIELDPILKPLHTTEPDRVKIVPYPPATSAELEQVSQQLKLRLPPSYLQLLSIHNGIDNFYWIENPLHSTAFFARAPKYAAHYELPDQFLFISGPDWITVGFDKTTQLPDGEMEVIEGDKTGETDRWPSLSDFLVGYRDRLEKWYADAQGDRAKTDDD
jgi:hypothetical protein